MYRTKINQTTPEFEKDVHKDCAIHKVTAEIKLMEGRIKNWKSELEKWEMDANKRLQEVNETDRIEFLTSLTEADATIQRDRSKSFEKIKQSYEEEMNGEATDPELFLLSYAEKDKNDKRFSKNARGHHPRGRGKGWRWLRD